MTYRLEFNRFRRHVEEKSSAEINCQFKDTATGATFTPTAVDWQLTDLAGKVYATGSETPSWSVDVFLYGDQLRLATGFTGQAEERVLLIEATYNKDALIGVPCRNSCRFFVRNLVAVI